MTRPARPRMLSDIQPLSEASARQVSKGLAKIPGDHMVLAARFYEILFQLAPDARYLFPADMTMQTERLAKGLLAAVAAAAEGDHQRVVPVLQNWGVRHRIQYQVTDDLYVYVCHALVRAVMELTDPTDTKAASAWTEVYEWLAAVMIDGADAFDAAPMDLDLQLDIRPREQLAVHPEPAEPPDGQLSAAAAYAQRRSRRGSTWFGRPTASRTGRD